MMARSVVVLPTVAAKKRYGFAGPDIEVDAVQGMAFAIPGIEPAHG